MTSKEFVIWLSGFVEAIDKEPTLTQLNTVKDKLTEVKDEEQIRTPIGVGGFGIPNTTPMWQQPHTINPYYIGDIPQVNLPFISTTPNGTGGNPTPPTFTISTMSGSSIINGVTSNGTTSITYGYPSGSSWHYTDVFNKK
jgi:hypothetical protein